MGARIDNPLSMDALEMLLSRYSGLGIGSDVLHMSVAELQGLYNFLTRLEAASTLTSGRDASTEPNAVNVLENVDAADTQCAEKGDR